MTILRAACLAALLCVACNEPCPAGHEPASDPAGRACQVDSECKIDCICVDPGDNSDEAVSAGECVAAVCRSAEAACRNACGLESFTGEFCD